MIFSLRLQLNGMLETAPILLLLLIILGFTLSLIKIRYPFIEKLVALFTIYIWIGMVILKWVWREPKRYKIARGTD